jgi:hypothetical protein
MRVNELGGLRKVHLRNISIALIEPVLNVSAGPLGLAVPCRGSYLPIYRLRRQPYAG